MIEREQVLLGERVKKLNDEERLAGRLLVHHLRQRRGASRNASWKRLCACRGWSSATGGCSPMTRLGSGIRSTMSGPFEPRASRTVAREFANSALVLPRSGRTRLWKA